jgi:hypothetical protein
VRKKCFNKLMVKEKAQKHVAKVQPGTPDAMSVCSTEEVAVCTICGSTPCEWEQCGLSVINLMLQAFDPDHRSTDSFLLDPRTNLPIDNKSARRVAYKCFQYEKYGTITVGKALPIPRCVINQIRELYP